MGGISPRPRAKGRRVCIDTIRGREGEWGEGGREGSEGGREGGEGGREASQSNLLLNYDHLEVLCCHGMNLIGRFTME